MIDIMPSLAQTMIYTFLFLLPGILCSFLLFKKANAIRHITFGICFSSALFTIINFVNHTYSLHSNLTGIIEYALLSIPLGLYFLLKIKTKYNTPHTMAIGRDWIALVGIIIFGIFWKLFFILPIKNFASAYDYASMFFNKPIPDLGFYTGMVTDHAYYVTHVINTFWLQMQDAVTRFNVSLILMTAAYLGFVYILCKDYSNNSKSALWATGIMALGPIEIFYTSGSIFGHPGAYLSVFSLFLLSRLSKEESFGRFALAFSSCLAMATIYYTSTLANILICAGFCTAIFFEKILLSKNSWWRLTIVRSYFFECWRDYRFKSFAFIFVISIGLLLIMSSGMFDTTTSLIKDTTPIKSFSVVQNDQPNIISGPAVIYPYQDPDILGISAIRAQGLILAGLGIIFLIYHLIQKRRNRFLNDKEIEGKQNQSLSISLTTLPVALTSFAFLYAGYPARAFDYFSFFALVLIITPGIFPKKIPSFAIKIAALITLIIMMLLGIQTMKDKKIYFERSDAELAGAAWVADNIQGKVFTDQVFASLLITNGFYNITGLADDDPRLADMFYNNDRERFLSAVKSEFVSGKIDYVVTTKKMREQFILMVNVPQISVQNSAFIDANLDKIYDNGDVRVYSTSSPK